jgi:hypothetical protein
MEMNPLEGSRGKGTNDPGSSTLKGCKLLKMMEGGNL